MESISSAGSSIGECGEKPGDCSDERMKRWAERKEEKRRQTKQRQQSAGAECMISSNTTRSSRSGSEPCIEEVFSKKGLPVVWRSVDVIGSGSFAKVYKGLWTKEGPGCEANRVVAVKVMNMKQSSRPRMNPDGSVVPPKWLDREVNTLQVQDHENLIQVIDFSLDSLPYTIVLEFCAGGSLHEVVSGNPKTTLERFGWQHRVKAALDVATGMQHLHKQRIVHRDLKVQNVLLVNPVLTANDVVHAKVCDFGLARYLPGDVAQTLLTVQVGSWYSMAPEMFASVNDGVCVYDEKVDVYAYGMMIYYMLAGDFLFHGDDMAGAKFIIFASDGGRPREDAIPASAPEVLRLVMKEAAYTDGETSKHANTSSSC